MTVARTILGSALSLSSLSDQWITVYILLSFVVCRFVVLSSWSFLNFVAAVGDVFYAFFVWAPFLGDLCFGFAFHTPKHAGLTILSVFNVVVVSQEC